MTNNADAQIARQWAEGFIKHADSAEIVDADALTAARHILATTTPPTMEDVDWDDAVHMGLCAEHPDYGLVRMTRLDADRDIWFLTDQLRQNFSHPDYLTPIPGTRVDLAPRRSEDVPDDSPLIPEDDWRYASDATVALWHRLVPEPTPDHPTVHTTSRHPGEEMATNLDLDQAREWAKTALNTPNKFPKGRAAAEVINALPDEWIDADKLREALDWRDSKPSGDDYDGEFYDRLRALLAAADYAEGVGRADA